MASFCEVPTANHDCYEACWSQGRACRICNHRECYRRGWRKERVDADNQRLVAAKLERG
jgi:hypothetical protein